MKKSLFFLFGVIAIYSCTNNSLKHDAKVDAVTEIKDTMQYGEMKTYWLVFLYSGPNRNQDSSAAAKIQQAHLANIDRLAKEGKIIMAGPMGDKTDLRGIFIMNCKDSLETVRYVQSDTAIITGRLRFEMHPWWTAQGKYEFK